MATHSEINKLVLHTAAYEGSDYDIEDIDQWHRDRGWMMVGYHYFILKDGTVQRGREDHMIGAHVKGHNTGSLGICIQGHGDYEEWTPEQWDAVVALCIRKMDEYDIPVEEIYGHRAFTDMKTCPGELVDMNEVREQIDLAAIAPIEPVPVEPPENIRVATIDELSDEIKS